MEIRWFTLLGAVCGDKMVTLLGTVCGDKMVTLLGASAVCGDKMVYPVRRCLWR